MSLGEIMRKHLGAVKDKWFLLGFLVGLFLGRLAGGDTLAFGFLVGLVAGLLLGWRAENGVK